MGNQSTGTESVVSIALACPFDERNIPISSILPQWLKLVRLNEETRIYHLKRKDQTGHVEYWKAQCGESRMLRLDGGKGRKVLPIRTKRYNVIASVMKKDGWKREKPENRIETNNTIFCYFPCLS